MAYLPETYEAANDWTEDTRISYIPNAKKPGTLSAERYSRYSKASTMGEALKLSSKTADLLHDFEKKFLLVAPNQVPTGKRLGLGRRRDGAEAASTPSKESAKTASTPVVNRLERVERPEAPVEPPVKKTAVDGGPSAAQKVETPKKEKPEKNEKPEKKEKKEEKQPTVMTQLRRARAECMESLMKALGLDYKAAIEMKLAPDNLEMMAERLMADRLAQLVLEAAEEQDRRVTDSEVLAVLKLWHFKRNEARQNVLPDGKKWVHSDTFGLIRNRTGVWMVTSATQEYPHVTKVLNTWFKARRPAELDADFPCTSISLNSNYAAKRHRDGNNAGPSMIAGFGNYTGGELAYWPDDDRSGYVEDLHHDDRKVLDINKSLVLFDGNRGHEVDDFQGERFSVVWFSAGKFWTMGRENKDFLVQCGFGASENEDLGAVKDLLPAPRGYLGRGCKSLTSMFGVAEKQQPAQVYRWPNAVDAKEEAQAQELLSGLTTELNAYVRAKEAFDAEVHARNLAEEAEASKEKQTGALDTLFAKAAVDNKPATVEEKTISHTAPASPSPASCPTESSVAMSAENKRAPARSVLAGLEEETPLSKRRRREKELATQMSVGDAKDVPMEISAADAPSQP